MIWTRLFRKHYFTTALIIVGFIAVGSLVANFLIERFEERGTFRVEAGADIFFSKLIDSLTQKGQDRISALRQIEMMSDGTLPFGFEILDEHGNSLSSVESPPLPWAKLEKPAQAYEFKHVNIRPNDRHDGPPGFYGLVRFPGIPIQYLYVHPNESGPHVGGPPPTLLLPHGPPPGPPGAGMESAYAITLGSLFGFLLLGIAFALSLLFRSMKQNMVLADQVISELQSGNLKARFPVKRMDEVGLAMTRFNKMADEVEHLVERLRAAEKSRMTLLQELAHDLRTPIASLKNLLATTSKKCTPTSGDPVVVQELLDLAQKEVRYFEKLVEDLLTLAQVSEPRYQSKQDIIALLTLLESEIQSLAPQGQLSGRKIDLVTEVDRFVEVAGDYQLLRRLFRNGLENALSFAKSRVLVLVERSNANEIMVSIVDDGPGFSDSALRDFGERRITRLIEDTQESRLSIGLGSVIMKTVTSIHGGKIEVKNSLDSNGVVQGGEVRITLPIRNSP